MPFGSCVELMNLSGQSLLGYRVTSWTLLGFRSIALLGSPMDFAGFVVSVGIERILWMRSDALA
jgi:hypothetical protein